MEKVFVIERALFDRLVGADFPVRWGGRIFWEKSGCLLDYERDGCDGWMVRGPNGVKLGRVYTASQTYDLLVAEREVGYRGLPSPVYGMRFVNEDELRHYPSHLVRDEL